MVAGMKDMSKLKTDFIKLRLFSPFWFPSRGAYVFWHDPTRSAEDKIVGPHFGNLRVVRRTLMAGILAFFLYFALRHVPHNSAPLHYHSKLVNNINKHP